MILWRNWGGWHALNVFFFVSSRITSKSSMHVAFTLMSDVAAILSLMLIGLEIFPWFFLSFTDMPFYYSEWQKNFKKWEKEWVTAWDKKGHRVLEKGGHERVL